MSDRLYVATRKGLFRIDRVAAQWRIGEPVFLGDSVSMVLPDPRDGTLYAALGLGHFGVKLRRSDDRGATWAELAAPAFPPMPEAHVETLSDGRPWPWRVEQVWALEAGHAEAPGVLWAGTIGGALFRSDDRGASWCFNRALWDEPQRKQWFGGGYDVPGIHSIVVDPRDPKHLWLAVSCGGVWETLDGGASWAIRCRGMRADYMPPDLAEEQAIQDPHRMVACAASPDHLWVQHHNGVFRSTDGAATWAELRHAAPSAFGFAVAAHPRDPGTAWFVPAQKDERRVPVDARVVVSRTRDGGRTFEVLSNGLPQVHAYDLSYRHALDVDDTGERLAFGSTTGSLWLSENGGDDWVALSAHLPPIHAVRFASS